MASSGMSTLPSFHFIAFNRPEGRFFVVAKKSPAKGRAQK
ncbi:hypothetical protein SynMEDNS5_02605 [Synechococcus sp. MEDNS5]|nr:hypothetical protein SynMEDNS5_02605 [Synechococcus sp. MEDNS5]